MPRKLIRLWSEYIYEEDSDFICGEREFEDLELSIVTAETVYEKFVGRWDIPKVSFEDINQWLESGEEYMHLGKIKWYMDDECDVHFELEIREYIQPPFGPLQGKRIYIDDWSWRNVTNL